MTTSNLYLPAPLLQTLIFTVDFDPTFVNGNTTLSSLMYTVFLRGVVFVVVVATTGSATRWRCVCDNHLVICSVLSCDLDCLSCDLSCWSCDLGATSCDLGCAPVERWSTAFPPNEILNFFVPISSQDTYT